MLKLDGVVVVHCLLKLSNRIFLAFVRPFVRSFRYILCDRVHYSVQVQVHCMPTTVAMGSFAPSSACLVPCVVCAVCTKYEIRNIAMLLITNLQYNFITRATLFICAHNRCVVLFSTQLAAVQSTRPHSTKRKWSKRKFANRRFMKIMLVENKLQQICAQRTCKFNWASCVDGFAVLNKRTKQTHTATESFYFAQTKKKHLAARSLFYWGELDLRRCNSAYGCLWLRMPIKTSFPFYEIQTKRKANKDRVRI